MTVHVRHIPADEEDRKRFAKQWREDRDFKEKVKKERFAKFQERRKNKPGGSGGGINVEVTREEP